ncbi:MAG: DNRLRE domain-containing protein [Candidatus Acidiferrum sp.]
MKTNMNVRPPFAHNCNLGATLMLVLLVATVARAQLTPSGDSYTNTADPITNYGAATLLDVKSASETAYIQFNLSSIPAGYTGADITQATLKLYVNAVTTAGSFNVDYVNGTWMESTITASKAPALGTTIAASVPLTTADKNQYILINVTAALQAWLNGTEPNDGIALVGNSPLNASFDSKENTTTSHPAELDIVFVGGGTITGVTTASGSGLMGGGTSGTLSLSLTNSCAANQVLQWNGTAWVCANLKGSGTITGVTAGADLTGGGTSGKVTLNVDTTKVPLLAAANTFTAGQLISSGGGSPSLSVSNSGGAAGVYSIAAGAGIFGETTTNTALGGIMGVDGSAAGTGNGVYGTSSGGNGVYGHSTTGNGVYGQTAGAGSSGVYGTNSAGGLGVAGTVPAGGTGVYGENQSTSVGGDGILGRAHTSNGNGVHGTNDASFAVGVYGESSAPNGYGVYGHALNGYGIASDSNVSQWRGTGGWVKAMVYVDPFKGGIQRCFNSQLPGSQATTVPCGISYTKYLVGQYMVDFGFQVDDRFLQFTALSGTNFGVSINGCLDDYCTISPSQVSIIESRDGTVIDATFFITVF